jgi:serine/threonine protein kinase
VCVRVCVRARSRARVFWWAMRVRRLQSSNLALDFVMRLLVTDPSRRISAAHALEHPWLNQSRGLPRAKYGTLEPERVASCGCWCMLNPYTLLRNLTRRLSVDDTPRHVRYPLQRSDTAHSIQLGTPSPLDSRAPRWASCRQPLAPSLRDSACGS